MPKIAKELGALEVKRLAHPGKGAKVLFPVGGVPGLMLQITPIGSKSWIMRSKVGAKRRDMGLGAYPNVGLAQAREKARSLRASVVDGRDPVAERKAMKSALEAEQRRSLTFAQATEAYLTTKVEIGKLTKHKLQWRSALDAYAKPDLGGMLTQDITMQDVLRCLEPIWLTKTETASRVRQRIEAVLSWATVAGHRIGDNPARWRGNLDHMLAKPSTVKVEENHPAISQGDAARWWAHLGGMPGIGALALRFAVLCAFRSGEVREATWKDVTFKTLPNGSNGSAEPDSLDIPIARMKAKNDHRVPLSDAAIAVLREAAGIEQGKGWPELDPDGLVFPAPRGGKLSDMTLSATMRRMHGSEVKAGRTGYLDSKSRRPAVPHGLRSTFRVWAAERGFERDMRGKSGIGHYPTWPC